MPPQHCRNIAAQYCKARTSRLIGIAASQASRQEQTVKKERVSLLLMLRWQWWEHDSQPQDSTDS